jgi:hypothetical protein
MYYRPFLLWAVIVGLFLKFAYVRYLIRLSWGRGAVADIAMNSASSLLNLIAVPMAFLVWTLPRLALNRVFGTDDTAPVGEMSGTTYRALKLVVHENSRKIGGRFLHVKYEALG